MRTLTMGVAVALVTSCSSTPAPAGSPASSTGGDENRPAEPAAVPLAKRLTSQRIDIGGQGARIPGYLSSFAFLAEMPDGSFRLGWNSDTTVRIIKLGPDLTRQADADVVMGNSVLAQLTPLQNGDLIAAIVPFQEHLFNAFDTPLAVDLVQLPAAGGTGYRTRIVGGDGTGPGKVWHAYSPTGGVRVAESDGELGAFVKVSRNFSRGAKPDTHQGDLFVVLDAKTGAIKANRTVLWSASHSNLMRLQTSATGEFLTLTVGDAYPFGIYFINRDSGAKGIVWPDEDQRTKEVIAKVRSTTGAGALCGFVRRGDDLYASIGTTRRLPYDGFRAKADILLTRFAPNGAVKKRTWLTETTDRSEGCPFMAPYGDGLLIATAEREERRANGPAQILLVDTDGTKTDEHTLEARLPSFTGDLVPLADGGVAWVVADYGDSGINVHRLRP